MDTRGKLVVLAIFIYPFSKIYFICFKRETKVGRIGKSRRFLAESHMFGIDSIRLLLSQSRKGSS